MAWRSGVVRPPVGVVPLPSRVSNPASRVSRRAGSAGNKPTPGQHFLPGVTGGPRRIGGRFSPGCSHPTASQVRGSSHAEPSERKSSTCSQEDEPGDYPGRSPPPPADYLLRILLGCSSLPPPGESLLSCSTDPWNSPCCSLQDDQGDTPGILRAETDRLPVSLYTVVQTMTVRHVEELRRMPSSPGS